MRILVSGASGLLGGALVRRLEEEGHAVGRLVRGAARGREEVRWSPAGGVPERGALSRWDALVHLAGRNLAGIWTARARREIRESRVRGTRAIAEAVAQAEPRPRVLLCASAVGFYGDRGGERLDEGSPAGEGFLAELCRDWEEAARPAREAGVRVVHLRFGLVLARGGGPLARLLGPFRWGLGGRLGDGRQWMSWVAIADAVAAMRCALEREELEGPVNVVSPEPVTNREFTRALARVLRRPAFLGVPAFALRRLPGGMGREALLASQRAVPARLSAIGFRFRFPALEPALREVLRAP